MDDHKVVRSGLKKALQEGFGDFAAGEAGQQAEALKLIWEAEWDVVLLDINLPGRNGLDLLLQIKQQQPRLPVIVISMYPEDEFAVRALKAGASSYLTKNVVFDELVQAVKRVVAGGKYITTSLGEVLARDVEMGEAKLHESLSNREFQVMGMLAAGQTVKEIAGDLCLSVKTISTYRTRILEKMQLRSNAELMRYAVRNGLALVQGAAEP